MITAWLLGTCIDRISKFTGINGNTTSSIEYSKAVMHTKGIVGVAAKYIGFYLCKDIHKS